MISTIRSIRRSFCNGAPNYEEAVITEKSKKIPMVCTNLIPLNILKALYMETTGTMHLFSRKSSSFAPTYPSTPPRYPSFSFFLLFLGGGHVVKAWRLFRNFRRTKVSASVCVEDRTGKSDNILESYFFANAKPSLSVCFHLFYSNGLRCAHHFSSRRRYSKVFLPFLFFFFCLIQT